ncbi:hypothetical protein D3C78_1649990 [compost metagenome]
MEACARSGQAHAKALALKQYNAQAVFKQPNLLAYRARRDMQRLCRGLDAAALSHFHKGAQRLQGIGHLKFRFTKFIRQKASLLTKQNKHENSCSPCEGIKLVYL